MALNNVLVLLDLFIGPSKCSVQSMRILRRSAKWWSMYDETCTSTFSIVGYHYLNFQDRQNRCKPWKHAAKPKALIMPWCSVILMNTMKGLFSRSILPELFWPFWNSNTYQVHARSVHARSEIIFVYPQKRIMCGYLDDTLRFFLQVRGSPRYILPGGLTLPRIRGCWMAYTQWYLPGPWRKPWKSSGHIVLPPAWAELVSEPPPVTKNCWK